jgi:hypothetical protein
VFDIIDSEFTKNDFSYRLNAWRQPLLEAGARYERTL